MWILSQVSWDIYRHELQTWNLKTGRGQFQHTDIGVLYPTEYSTYVSFRAIILNMSVFRKILFLMLKLRKATETAQIKDQS